MKKFKLLIMLILLVLLTAFMLVLVSANPKNISVKIDGKIINFPDIQPYVNSDSRMLVPLRFISEELKCTVNWDESVEVARIKKGTKEIIIKVGNRTVAIVDKSTKYVKYEEKEFDTRAVLKDGRTMVPLRFISELLGVGIAWDAANNMVILRSDGTIEKTQYVLPEPTPTPTNIPGYSAPVGEGYEKKEYFDLISESGSRPEGFKIPKFYALARTTDPVSVYFENVWDYLWDGGSSFKVECINKPELNVWYAYKYDGTQDKFEVHTDSWHNIDQNLNIMGYTPNENIRKMIEKRNLIPVWVYNIGIVQSITPDMKCAKSELGDRFDIKVTFKKGDYECVLVRVHIYDLG